jgi:hypothetical protein
MTNISLRRYGLGLTGLFAGTAIYAVIGSASFWAPGPEIARLLRETGDLPPEADRPVVVLVFRPTDCPSRLDGIDRLNWLHRLGRLRVVGLFAVDTSEYDDWRAVVRANRIEFPVRVVPDRRAARASRQLGYLRTPVYLAVDRRGRLAAAGDVADSGFPALTSRPEARREAPPPQP